MGYIFEVVFSFLFISGSGYHEIFTRGNYMFVLKNIRLSDIFCEKYYFLLYCLHKGKYFLSSSLGVFFNPIIYQ